MSGQSSYQKAGTNYDMLNGSNGSLVNQVIADTTEHTIWNVGNGEVIDMIDIYVAAGAIDIFLTYPGPIKLTLSRAGCPGKILYPGRYGLNVNLLKVTVQGVNTGVAPDGAVHILTSDSVDQTANIP